MGVSAVNSSGAAVGGRALGLAGAARHRDEGRPQHAVVQQVALLEHLNDGLGRRRRPGRRHRRVPGRVGLPTRGVDPVEAYYAVQGWDSLSRDAAVEAANQLGVSPFAFIKSLTERASPPWITPADIQETITRLRGAGTARSSGAAVTDTRTN